MKAGTGSIILVIYSLLFLAPAQAETYVEASAGLVFVHTPADSTYPPVIDLRLGIAEAGKQFELALMRSIHEDRLNDLTIETPTIVSLLYHHIPQTTSDLKLHLIVGASRVEIESTFPVVGKRTESFSSLSYGVGFEEHFKSIPRLKLSLDLMQLYLGDDLDVYSMSLGAHYEF